MSAPRGSEASTNASYRFGGALSPTAPTNSVSVRWSSEPTRSRQEIPRRCSCSSSVSRYTSRYNTRVVVPASPAASGCDDSFSSCSAETTSKRRSFTLGFPALDTPARTDEETGLPLEAHRVHRNRIDQHPGIAAVGRDERSGQTRGDDTLGGASVRDTGQIGGGWPRRRAPAASAIDRERDTASGKARLRVIAAHS